VTWISRRRDRVRAGRGRRVVRRLSVEGKRRVQLEASRVEASWDSWKEVRRREVRLEGVGEG
jgi:hypothetical protein